MSQNKSLWVKVNPKDEGKERLVLWEGDEIGVLKRLGVGKGQGPFRFEANDGSFIQAQTFTKCCERITAKMRGEAPKGNTLHAFPHRPAGPTPTPLIELLPYENLVDERETAALVENWLAAKALVREAEAEMMTKAPAAARTLGISKRT